MGGPRGAVSPRRRGTGSGQRRRGRPALVWRGRNPRCGAVRWGVRDSGGPAAGTALPGAEVPLCGLSRTLKCCVKMSEFFTFTSESFVFISPGPGAFFLFACLYLKVFKHLTFFVRCGLRCD